MTAMYERIQDESHAFAVEFRADRNNFYVIAYENLAEALEGALENEHRVLSAIEFRGGNHPLDVSEDFEDRLADARGARAEDAAAWRAHEDGTRTMRRMA